VFGNTTPDSDALSRGTSASSILDDAIEVPADRRLDLAARFGATERVIFRHTNLPFRRFRAGARGRGVFNVICAIRKNSNGLSNTLAW